MEDYDEYPDFFDSENDSFGDDMYDDDFFDEDYEEEEKFRKVFVTLQDSHVISRLSFYKNMAGQFR
jgi:hypothetical protein